MPLEESVSVRLTKDQKTQVKKIAKALGIKSADVIRMCVFLQLDQLERTGNINIGKMLKKMKG